MSGKNSKGNKIKKKNGTDNTHRMKGIHEARERFHLKLKHVLGGVSLLSLLAAFEVFSIPAASGIVELFVLTKSAAAEVWFGTAVLTGFAALYLHREEQENDI